MQKNQIGGKHIFLHHCTLHLPRINHIIALFFPTAQETMYKMEDFLMSAVNLY